MRIAAGVADQAVRACQGWTGSGCGGRGAARSSRIAASTSYTQGLNTNHCPGALSRGGGPGRRAAHRSVSTTLPSRIRYGAPSARARSKLPGNVHDLAAENRQ